MTEQSEGTVFISNTPFQIKSWHGFWECLGASGCWKHPEARRIGVALAESWGERTMHGKKGETAMKAQSSMDQVARQLLFANE